MAAAWRALTLLCIVGFIFLSVIPSTTCSKTVFYIYGSASCFSCKAFSDELKKVLVSIMAGKIFERRVIE